MSVFMGPLESKRIYGGLRQRSLERIEPVKDSTKVKYNNAAGERSMENQSLNGEFSRPYNAKKYYLKISRRMTILA
jgi:hypothetical protein